MANRAETCSGSKYKNEYIHIKKEVSLPHPVYEYTSWNVVARDGTLITLNTSVVYSLI
jgi:hypothetical protein